MGKETGKVILVNVERCEGINCRSDEEIEEFIRSNSILMLLNQQEYRPEDYTEDVI